MSLTWQDSRAIGEALLEKFGATDPLTVRFTDMHKAVCELPGFADDPKKSNERILEAIQMAWYDEWKDEYEND
ncbi:MAG: Fe-S cluster assembly protein IscX [Gemmataceae bacterium]